MLATDRPLTEVITATQGLDINNVPTLMGFLHPGVRFVMPVSVTYKPYFKKTKILMSLP